VDANLNTYDAEAFCSNCGFEGSITSEVGKRVWQNTCPLCQCESLHAVADEHWLRRIGRLDTPNS
jgi:hypothetical protein